MFRFLSATVFLALALPAHAQDWKIVTEELTQTEKPGFGKISGVVVDHATGDVSIWLSDKGLYRSTNQGKSWRKVGMTFKGRTETPGCMMLDPLGGKRMATALVYGAPILVSPDMGENWTALDKKTTHVDWFAADWSDPQMKLMLTLKHEAADLLLISSDGGKSFAEVGKGFGPAWIFDAKTAVVAQAKSKTNPKPGLLRTTDACKTFEPCGEYHAKALPRWHKDALYWIVEGALIVTKDQGKSWQKISDLKDGKFGPIFGKTAEHLFVLAQNGILESTNGGQTWNKPLSAPKEMKGVANLTWLDYDPVHDIVYIMKMGSELYRWERSKK